MQKQSVSYPLLSHFLLHNLGLLDAFKLNSYMKLSALIFTLSKAAGNQIFEAAKKVNVDGSFIKEQCRLNLKFIQRQTIL